MSDEFENEFIDHELKRGSQRFAYTDPATGEKKIGYGEVPLPHGEYPADMDLENEEAMAQYDLERFKIRGVNVLKYSPEDFEDIRSQDEGSQLTDPAWIASSKILYRTTQDKAFEGEDKDVAQWGLDFMDRFEANLPAMLVNTNTVLQAPTPVQSAMYYLMETYDRKGLDLRSTLRQVAWSLADPSNLFGLGTLGVGFVAKGGAKKLSKAGFKTLLKESILSKPNLATILTGVDAAAVTAAYDAAQQNIEIGAGVREEFDPTQTAIAGGVGAVVGDRLAAGSPAIVEGARRAGTGVAEAVTEKAGQVYEGVENLTNLNVVPPKRVGTTGQYVGAPPGLDSPQKLAALRNNMMKIAKAGEEGRFWYERSGRALLDLLDGDVKETDKLAQAIAITSSGSTPVLTNFQFAIQAYYQHRAGKEIRTGKFPTAQSDRLKKLFDGEDWPGRKTNTFYNNIMAVVDPSRAQGVTVDMHMMRVFGFENDAPSPKQYDFIEKEVTRIGDKLGWTPYQVQAAMWVKQKADRAGKPVSEMKFDYSDALKKNLGQISSETKPSKSSGHFPELFDAPMQEQADFHLRMSKALTNDDGKDLIAKEVGLLSPGSFDAPGIYKGVLSPGTQTYALMPPQYKGEPGEVEQGAIDLVKIYAVAKGILLKQDSVGAHRVFVKKGYAKDRDAVAVDIGRRFTDEEMVKLDLLLTEEFKSNDFSPASTELGVNIVHWMGERGKMDFTDFQDKVRKVLKKMEMSDIITPSGKLEAGTAASQKVYVTNEVYNEKGDVISSWKEEPNGRNYLEGAFPGRPDLQARVDSIVTKLADRVDAVEDEIVRDYGWTKLDYNSKYRGQQEEAAEQIAPSPDTDPSVLGERPPQPPAMEDP
tara:strand:+ start:6589 stop:9198 length:2610 start_codon:yes stop_codon:yes gene_type:complete